MGAHGKKTPTRAIVRRTERELALRSGSASQSGFTLIEVLVAVALTAIGLLGLASLQMTSIGGTRAGSERTQAAMLALDIGDRMRHNIDAARDGEYDLDAGAIPDAASCRSDGADCSTADLAAADLSEWRALVGASITGGDASVATSANGNVTNVTVTISWVDTRALDDEDQQGRLVFAFTI
jgi:type IV pilus assembly protein PilV